jgi:DNA-binding transcriptional regulator LsrR (DeoR family)
MTPRGAAAGPAALVLMATVARRHFIDGAGKSEIADELGLSRFKVARLITQARASGLVRVELDYRGEIDLDLSVRLSAAYSLRHCIVTESPEDDEVILRDNLGRAGAELLTEVLGADDVLGLAWARSLMEMRTALDGLPSCPVVQLTGALSRPDVDASGTELVRDVARASGGPALFFYAPLIAPDAATARALRTQPEIDRAFTRFGDVTTAVVGVGAWQRGLSTVADAVTDEELRESRELGVRAELAGIQLDAEGQVVKTSFTDRLIAIDVEQLRAVPDVIGLVYGTAKADAVLAALRGGLLTSLVTHTAMARELLERA